MTYTQEVRQAISVSQSLAREYRHATFGPPHLLKAILHNETGLPSWLASIRKDFHFMREWADIRMENYPKAAYAPENPGADPMAVASLELAGLIAMQLNKDMTDPVCVLAAILKPGIAFTPEQLRTFPVHQKEIMDAAVAEDQLQQAIKKTPDAAAPEREQGPEGVRTAALFKYCVDKTALAQHGELDPIIGRDKELRMMLEVLGRRTKPNVIIVGEPGVGKTALIDGFARLIVEGHVPDMLRKARLFELDTGALVAGAAYKGETEDRIKNIIKEIKQFEKAILFIDEIHLLLDSRGSIGTGVVNLLKPELARGELTLIGATTNEEYRKYIEADQAFSRRFELVRVGEPTEEVAVNMLRHILPLYEKHHGLTTEPDAVSGAVIMAKRYSKDKRLPDSAVDLVDRTMAAIRMMGESSVRDIGLVREDLDKILAAHSEGVAGLVGELKDLHRGLKDKISPLLYIKLQEEEALHLSEEAGLHEPDLETASSLTFLLTRTLDKLLNLASTKKQALTRSDIAAMIAFKTGIPLGKIQSGEREKLLKVEEILKKRVVGQDHAIKAVADAILESRSGLIKAGQPIASFFLTGPTGTGKTELAKSLADFLFNDESFLIRFDMSEFKEEHSAALLYGAPPGYVGYEEGGVLVNKIRQKPYSVVLFDEIEKAHPSVFDTFLQILDEGKLHDRLGKEGDFSNSIILFTSNIGSELIAESFSRSVIPSSTEMMDILTKYFRPEFLARLTEIVPFAPITEDNVIRIFDIHLRGLTLPLGKLGISLSMTPAVKRWLALSGFTPKYGARQIKGVIRNQLRRPVSRMIIGNKLVKGNNLHISLNEQADTLEWQVNQTLEDPVNRTLEEQMDRTLEDPAS